MAVGVYHAELSEPVNIDKLAEAVGQGLESLYDTAASIEEDECPLYAMGVDLERAESFTFTFDQVSGDLESIAVEEADGNQKTVALDDESVAEINPGYTVSADLADCKVSVSFYADDEDGSTKWYNTVLATDEPRSVIDRAKEVVGLTSSDDIEEYRAAVDRLDGLEAEVSNYLGVDAERTSDMHHLTYR